MMRIAGVTRRAGVGVAVVMMVAGCQRKPRGQQPTVSPQVTQADAAVGPGVERVDLHDPSGGTLSCRPLGPAPGSVDEVLFSCGRHELLHVEGGKLAALQTVKLWAQEVPASALSAALQSSRHHMVWQGSQLIGIGKSGVERWVGPDGNTWDQLAEVPPEGAVASLSLSGGPGHQLWVLMRDGRLFRGNPPMLVEGRLVFDPVCAAGVLEKEFGVQSALNGQVLAVANDRIYVVLESRRELVIARVEPESCALKRVAIPEMPPQPVDRLPPGAVGGGRGAAVGLVPVGYTPPFLGVAQRLHGKLMLHRRFDLLELAEDDSRWEAWTVPAGVDLGRNGGGAELIGGGLVWTTYGSARAVVCRDRRCQPLALPAGTELAWAAAWPDGRIALYESQPRVTLLPVP